MTLSLQAGGKQDNLIIIDTTLSAIQANQSATAVCAFLGHQNKSGDSVLISKIFYTISVCKYCCVKCRFGIYLIIILISFVHRDIGMRILECPPSDKPGYVDEAEQFYMHPLSWLLEHFGNSSGREEEVRLPTHIVLYNVLLPVSLSFLISLNDINLACIEIFPLKQDVDKPNELH